MVRGERPVDRVRCAKIKLTPRCNLRCVFCNYWKMPPQPELPVSRWRDVIAELAEMGCAKIHFSGGEPLLLDGLHDILAHTEGLGIRANMTTNATLIRDGDAARRLLQTGVRSVSVSIDSPHRKDHDRLRGSEGALKRTLRGLERLVAVAGQTGAQALERMSHEIAGGPLQSSAAAHDTQERLVDAGYDRGIEQ